MNAFKDDFQQNFFFPRDQVFVKLNPDSLPPPVVKTSGRF